MGANGSSDSGEGEREGGGGASERGERRRRREKLCSPHLYSGSPGERDPSIETTPDRESCSEDADPKP